MQSRGFMTQKSKEIRIAGLLATLVLAMTLTACGQSEPGGDTSNSNAEQNRSAGNAGQDPAQVAAAGEAAQKAAQAATDANVPGAIIATLNGETRTWYVANNLTEWDGRWRDLRRYHRPGRPGRLQLDGSHEPALRATWRRG